MEKSYLKKKKSFICWGNYYEVWRTLPILKLEEHKDVDRFTDVKDAIVKHLNRIFGKASHGSRQERILHQRWLKKVIDHAVGQNRARPRWCWLLLNKLLYLHLITGKTYKGLPKAI